MPIKWWIPFLKCHCNCLMQSPKQLHVSSSMLRKLQVVITCRICSCCQVKLTPGGKKKHILGLYHRTQSSAWGRQQLFKASEVATANTHTEHMLKNTKHHLLGPGRKELQAFPKYPKHHRNLGLMLKQSQNLGRHYICATDTCSTGAKKVWTGLIRFEAKPQLLLRRLLDNKVL